MKHLKIITTTLFLSVICLSSCKKGPIWGIKGKGSNETRVINVSGFSKIDLSIDASVSYIQDSIYRVEVIAQPNIQDIIKINLEGDRLIIKSDKNIRPRTHIEVVVHSPDMYGLYISGSGNIIAGNQISTSSLEVNVSGSGDISIASIITQRLNAEISGSGNIKVSGGTTAYESFSVSGSGNVNAIGIQADKSIVDVSGSGDMNIWVLQNLSADISGSGDIKYKGQPVINSQISGSGKLAHIY